MCSVGFLCGRSVLADTAGCAPWRQTSAHFTSRSRWRFLAHLQCWRFSPTRSLAVKAMEISEHICTIYHVSIMWQVAVHHVHGIHTPQHFRVFFALNHTTQSSSISSKKGYFFRSQQNAGGMSHRCFGKNKRNAHKN